jgi:hypothetical protein
MTMNDAARYACDNCKDRGWIKVGDYIERPLSTKYLVTRWIPCQQCHAALKNPRSEPMSIAATNYVPKGVKPTPIPGNNYCGFCNGKARKIVEVPIGNGTVEVENPCFRCEAILFFPFSAYPIQGPKFDFARDLIEANYAPRRRNPRIL